MNANFKLDVDRIIFGLGPNQIKISAKQRIKNLNKVYKLGIYQFETAPFYLLGQNESNFYNLKNKKKLSLITKFGFNNPILPKIFIKSHLLTKIFVRLFIRFFYPRNTDYNGESAEKSLLGSINRMGKVPKILLLHGTSRDFKEAEKKQFFKNTNKLKKKFKIQKIGVASANKNTIKIYDNNIDVIMTNFQIFNDHLSKKINKNKLYLLYSCYKFWNKNLKNISFFSWLNHNLKKFPKNVKFIITTTDENKINKWKKYF
jgi:aryl-alcohol dehydrogenase-like predicted oxidoreductase